MRTTTIRLPEDLHETLEAEADEHDLSFSEYVRRILRARDANTPTEYANTEANTAANTSEYDERIRELEERVGAVEEHLENTRANTGANTPAPDGPDPVDRRDRSDEEQGEAGEAGRAALDDVDFPAGREREACADAVHAARDYLREHGAATKRELVAEVMPAHSLGYDASAAREKVEAGERYRGAWWRRVVMPGLKALPDVEAPARGANEWRYAAEAS